MAAYQGFNPSCESLINDPAVLAQALSLLTVPDTGSVKHGEKVLKQFMKRPQCIFSLINQITNSQVVEIRHHAAIYCKKKIALCYESLDVSNRQALRTSFMQLLLSEPIKGVRLSIAGAISMLAKYILSVEKQQWPELFQLLLTLSEDPNADKRALTYQLLEQLADQVAEQFIPFTSTLATMFTAGCQDIESVVSSASMIATANYIRNISQHDDVLILKSVLTPMIGAMQKCLDNGDDHIVCDGLGVFQECSEMDQPLLNDHTEIITPFLVQILQNPERSEEVQQAAGTTLNSIIEARPKLLAKKQLVKPIITALMQILCRPVAKGSLFTLSNDRGILEEDDEEDDEEDPAVALQRTVQCCIDTMAISIPSKHFVQPALELCSIGIQATDPHMRKAACAVLGVIVEGCNDAIKQQLPSILPPLLACAGDAEHFVRECACFALGQFSEHCQPDILHYHQQVLPVIYNSLNDPQATVQGTACYTLEMFCENLQPETLRPYTQALMTKLAVLLTSPSRTVQEMALTAIAATAVAAGIEFLPFADATCAVLHPLMCKTEPIDFQLRGRALECFGHIAVAIEKDNFARYLDVGMRSAIEGIALKDEGLQEHAYVFFANASKVMGKDMARYSSELVPHLLEVLKESDFEHGEEGGGSDDGSDDGVYLRVHEGFVNSKKAAVTALGMLAEYTLELFAPYLVPTMEALYNDSTGSLISHEVVRSESLLILKSVTAAALASVGITATPVQAVLVAMPADFVTVLQKNMDTCIKALQEDESKECVAAASESLSGIISSVGYSTLACIGEANTSALYQSILLILQEKSVCQLESKKEEDDDDDDHDNIVIDGITDLIGALGKAIGPTFITTFNVFITPLLKFTKESRSFSDRSMAIGCFAEVVESIGTGSIAYLDVILPILQRGLADPMEAVRRNSAFCVATLVKSCREGVVHCYAPFLQLLYPLCANGAVQTGVDAGGADIDNALSAVASMINTSIESVPLDQVLPVMINALPLRADHVEGENVYGVIIKLLESNNPIAVGMKDKLVPIFKTALTTLASTVETKAIIQRYLLANNLV